VTREEREKRRLRDQKRETTQDKRETRDLLRGREREKRPLQK